MTRKQLELEGVAGNAPPRHECHAAGCTIEVPPRMLMCARHWRMVRPDVRDLVWRLYRPGQERDKRPSSAYLRAHHLAIACVAEREGRRRAFQEHAELAVKFTELSQQERGE